LRTHAIAERLRGVFTTRRYTNLRLPLPSLGVFLPSDPLIAHPWKKYCGHPCCRSTV